MTIGGNSKDFGLSNMYAQPFRWDERLYSFIFSKEPTCMESTVQGMAFDAGGREKITFNFPILSKSLFPLESLSLILSEIYSLRIIILESHFGFSLGNQKKATLLTLILWSGSNKSFIPFYDPFTMWNTMNPILSALKFPWLKFLSLAQNFYDSVSANFFFDPLFRLANQGKEINFFFSSEFPFF